MPPMPALLESVPNFSAGRDTAAVAAIKAAVEAHASVLDVHSDADHNRSVLTCVGTADGLVDPSDDQGGDVSGLARVTGEVDDEPHLDTVAAGAAADAG